MDYVLKAEPAVLNLSPGGFLYAAKDCLECYKQFRPEKFSLIQYFLLCRTIELSLKAIHLKSLDREKVKKRFSHDLLKSYKALPASDQILSADQVQVLQTACDLYKPPNKAFEYLRITDAFGAYENFPDLNALADIAQKIIQLAQCGESESE